MGRPSDEFDGARQEVGVGAILDTKDIMALIAYKQGLLVQVVEDEGDEPPQVDIQVVKFDRGRLLVRLEEGVEVLNPDVPLALEVPTERALYRLEVTVDRIVDTMDHAYMVHLVVDDVEEIQRRKQDRFPVNYRCSFIPMREGETEADLHNRRSGTGRVTDISLGGLEFETEYELPNGLLALLEVTMPSGRLVFEGKLVKAIRASVGKHTYGVKFGKMDNVTSQRLNRLILSMERRKRAAERSGAGQGGGRSRRFGGRDRVRRAISARWADRDRRRRER